MTGRRVDSRAEGAVVSALRSEAVGGLALLVAAAAAVVWANLPQGEAYEALREVVPVDRVLDVGGLSFALDLTLATWAADGLLAIFFFVVALELKREVFAGELRDPRRALLPVAAAVAGLVTPAVVYVAVAWRGGAEALSGWAIPAATDIAFALAVLAVLGSRLPAALRAFLLTLAVVDDLLAITIIAVFFTDGLRALYLLGGLLPLALFAVLVRRGVTAWYLLLPLAGVHWLFVHESGVHATIAGVLLGLVVPVARRGSEGPCLATHLEHVWRPVSAGLAAPVFAFLAAGVPLGGDDVLALLQDPVAQGVVAGLVVGKAVGITAGTYLTVRFTGARLDESLAWRDVFGMALLAGIGFTISLLIADLSFADGSTVGENAVPAVLLGSLLAAGLAVVVLAPRRSTRVESTGPSG